MPGRSWRLTDPNSGEILFEGRDLTKLKKEEIRRERKNIQIVFQDPFGSLNPQMTVGELFMEPLRKHRCGSGQEIRKQAAQSKQRVHSLFRAALPPSSHGPETRRRTSKAPRQILTYLPPQSRQSGVHRTVREAFSTT